MALKLKLLFSCLLLLAIILALNTRMGQIPPLGKFLDPFAGVWQNALIPDIPDEQVIKIDGLKEEVKIVFNERGVPHIFAKNNHDLYFATAYVTSMHRLWQMEFTAHAGLGRISEFVGEQATEFDRYLRRIGMHYGTEKVLKLMQEDREMLDILEAYTAGVNAWINQLKDRQLPFEYKLLDLKPQPWSPLKTASLVMNINRTLSFSTTANGLTHLKAAWGEEAVLAFFPSHTPMSEPIISAGTSWDFLPEPPTKPSCDFIPQFVWDKISAFVPEGIGSNNWAVSPQRTSSGHALLAYDPHLSLTLPSIWYELQLNAPGINVYGVTFPGTPFVITGFNEHIAWGNTNSANLVVDIFEIELDNTRKKYLFEGVWLPLTMRIEEIMIRGKNNIIDTVWYTHHGPVVSMPHEQPFNTSFPVAHSMQWTALEPAHTFRALHQLNLAHDFSTFREGLSLIGSPAQNYVFASTNGDIAMQTNGLWPIRWKTQGMFTSDGRSSSYDWKGYIPFDHLPFELNPQRGFVSSANQVITDTLYPYWYGWNFATSARGSVINSNLQKLHHASIEDMIQLQLNAENYYANTWLKQMTDSVEFFLENNSAGNVSEELHALLDTLKNWNQINEANLVAPTLFNQWVDEVHKTLWDPLLEPLQDNPIWRPSLDVSWQVLFHHPPADHYAYLMGQYPPTGELLTAGLNSVINILQKEKGMPGESWHWWRFNGTTLNHLLQIPALGMPRLQVPGYAHSPNAIKNAHGPSWRMVAEMSEPIQAWGVYPGGQSANPATAGYNAFVQQWVDGNYYPLILYNNYEDAAAQNENIITLKPAR